MAEQIPQDTAGDDPDQVAERPELANPYVEPRNDIERGLAGIWSETIGICEIGVEDNFFELGGHSLLAARLIGRALETFAVEVSIVDLFTEDPTIAGMARIIERQLAQGAE
jgi:hypothetical protein